jgi:hypothetical protein
MLNRIRIWHRGGYRDIRLSCGNRTPVNNDLVYLFVDQPFYQVINDKDSTFFTINLVVSILLFTFDPIIKSPTGTKRHF